MNSDALTRFSDQLEVELTANILPFWMTRAPDRERGGFHGRIDRHNRVVRNAGKGAVMHARILWTFSAAYRQYGERAYLDAAERAYRYILDHFIDRELGGVFWEVDAGGGVLRDRKQVYAIAFTIYALAEFHMAMGDPEALDLAAGLFTDIESHARDRERNGYLEALARDWSRVEDVRLSEKDPNESKTMNTHLHILEAYASLYRIRKEPVLEEALGNIIRLFLERFIDPVTFHLRLFFDDDWQLRSDFISYGHDIECSWLLCEAARILGDEALVREAEVTAERMARQNLTGLDTDHGLSYEFFPEEERTDTEKHWWPQAEAMVGYFNAWEITGDPLLLERSMDVWDFVRERIIDRRHGEWFWSVDRQGRPNPTEEKAGFWKSPYHNGRACMELVRRIDASRSPERRA